MTIHAVSSEALSNFDNNALAPGDEISVRIDPSDEKTEIARLQTLFGQKKTLFHTEYYYSTKEFATVTMKQALTLYVKRKIIEMYPDEYSQDDPRVHSYVSRLSYKGIKHVANNLTEFAEQFRSGRITMKIPKFLNDRHR